MGVVILVFNYISCDWLKNTSKSSLLQRQKGRKQKDYEIINTKFSNKEKGDIAWLLGQVLGITYIISQIQQWFYWVNIFFLSKY